VSSAEGTRRLGRRRGRRRPGADITSVEEIRSASEAPEAEASVEKDAPVATTPAPAARAKARTGVQAFVLENVRLVAALAMLVLGIVLVILGWYGAAHTNILTEQIPYLISGGLLGMALIIVAGVIGSSASLERENREVRRDLARALGAERVEQFVANPGPRRSSAGNGRVYVVPGGRSFHVAGCPIVEGKDGTELELSEALRAGFATCKLCGPD